MKTIQELDSIRVAMQSQVNLRRHHDGPQVIVAAGSYAEGSLARQLVAAFLAECNKHGAFHVAVKLCDAPEGEVTVIKDDETKTFTGVTVEQVAEIFAAAC